MEHGSILRRMRGMPNPWRKNAFQQAGNGVLAGIVASVGVGLVQREKGCAFFAIIMISASANGAYDLPSAHTAAWRR
jgi:hypothetical protein